MAPPDGLSPPDGHAVCPARCDQCGVHALGVDPGFSLHMVALLIPCSARALRKHLSTFKADYPPHYRRAGTPYRWHRVLLASEVRQIRARMFREGSRAPSPHRLVEAAVELHLVR
jgi:hypothetical protein